MSEHKDELEQVRAGLRRWSEGDVELSLAELKRRRDAEARLAGSLPELRQSLRRWDDEQVEDGLRSLRFRMNEARPAGRRLALAGAAVVVAAAVALVAWRGVSGTTASSDQPRTASLTKAAPALGATAAARHLALADGSDVTLPDSASQARVAEESPNQVTVVVEGGRAQFRVKHRAERRFLVQIGGVQVEDLGTVFNVERGALEVSIQVLEGRVRVLWQGQRAELGAGEQGRYPLAEPSGASEPAGKAPSASSAEPKAPVADVTWRAEAREGRYKEAFQLLERESFGSVRDEPSDLLLAADVARLSGHAEKAVQPLRSLLRRHRADPRSPAAAFTLGSVLLRDLGRANEAAQAFDDAVRLAPAGNLSEDAAARAAEAWFKAGQRARAEAALQRYQAQHPAGRHLAFLKRLIQSRD